MAKTSKYWKKRSEQKLTRVLADAEKTLNLLESQYKNASISINKDIKKLYSQFAGENNISMDKAMEIIHGNEFLEWRMSMDEYLANIEMTGNKKLLLELNTLAMRSRITRLEALNAEIMANVAYMTQGAEKNTSLLLIRSLENTYYEGMYDEYKDRNPKVFDLMEKHNVGLSKAQIDRELKIPWSGANYSTNLWNNADYIAGKCQKLVAQNIIAGTSVDKLTQEITKQFGKNYRASARRLLLTETAYIKGQADMLVYDRLEIEEYALLATLDRKTSTKCQKLDGKHYKRKDAVVGENYPPLHPNCRTITVKHNPDTEDRTRIARDADGKNIDVPRNMKYKDWLEWVKSGQSLDDWLADNPEFNLIKGIDNKDKGNMILDNTIIEPEETDDENYNVFLKRFTNLGVDYLPVKDKYNTYSESEIISQMSGGDRTRGSCASLGMAYIGQKQGYDVLDFRGGESQFTFSLLLFQTRFAKLKGVVSKFGKYKGANASANNLLKSIEVGKEYYLGAGKHAAIVRKLEGDKYQYLELQSENYSGWTDFNENPRYTLKTRFGCSNQDGKKAFIIDIDASDFSTYEFRSLLGFINTSVDGQMKGKGGYEK